VISRIEDTATSTRAVDQIPGDPRTRRDGDISFEPRDDLDLDAPTTGRSRGNAGSIGSDPASRSTRGSSDVARVDR